MSNIDTNGIDVNYPIPGVNNSTQGFRSNFTAIKTNLDTAGNEITNLQQNVVLKSALANTTLNNDMANTLIANASTLGFRSTTYNLGNALTGTVKINAALADIHYGQLAGNITLNTGSWAPVNTQQSIEVHLSTSNADANWSISVPGNIVSSNNYGTTLIENFANISNVGQIFFPYGQTELNFRLSTVDCGNSIYITPLNRSYQSTQIVKRSPPSTGQPGDRVGDICVDAGTTQLLVTGANTDPWFVTANTSSLVAGMPVTVTGVSFEPNVVVGNTYYVRNVVSSTTFTLASTAGGANIGVAANVTGNTTLLLNPVQYMYLAVGNYDSGTPVSINILSTTAPNVITLDAGSANYSGNLSLNQPVIFPDLNGIGNSNVSGPNTVYYIKTWNSGSGDITVSMYRNNGVAGIEFTGILTAANATVVGTDLTTFTGSDIWRRMPFNPF